MVFSAVAMVSSFEAAHDLVGVSKKNETNNNCKFPCAMLTQLDVEGKWSGENRSAQLVYPNRNETVP